MPKNNPFVLGFIVSLAGALPLGYINVIGLQILMQYGIWAVSSFILGVIFVEFFVLKAASFGAKWLVQQKKILLIIDLFTVLFFSSIAYYFYTNIGSEKSFSLTQLQLVQYPFIFGMILNSLNFMQWPYWSGVFLYLFRTKKINHHSRHNNIFIIAALMGTFSGIMIFAQTGSYFLMDSNAAINKYLNTIFALLFSVLAFIQITNFFWKKKKNKLNVVQESIKITS